MSKDIWEKLRQFPGGGTDPFRVPIGPTKECLSAVQAVAFVDDGERDEDIKKHLEDCSECRKRINQFKAARNVSPKADR